MPIRLSFFSIFKVVHAFTINVNITKDSLRMLSCFNEGNLNIHKKLFTNLRILCLSLFALKL